jgi:hypothetical protein
LDEARLLEITRTTADWLVPRKFVRLREWAYDQARPLLLVEEFIGEGASPTDYKFFMFDGEPHAIEVDVDRYSDHRRSFYATDWRRMPITLRVPSAGDQPRPDRLDEMVEVAADLARDFDFIRIDLYEVDGEIWFGEFTPYPNSGLVPFEPASVDLLWGSRWQLPAM